MARQFQVSKETGSPHRFSLDPISSLTLTGIQKFLSDHAGKAFSKSVLVRRAIRHYLEFLNTDRYREDLELTEIIRASKGIR